MLVLFVHSFAKINFYIWCQTSHKIYFIATRNYFFETQVFHPSCVSGREPLTSSTIPAHFSIHKLLANQTTSFRRTQDNAKHSTKRKSFLLQDRLDSFGISIQPNPNSFHLSHFTYHSQKKDQNSVNVTVRNLKEKSFVVFQGQTIFKSLEERSFFFPRSAAVL